MLRPTKDSTMLSPTVVSIDGSAKTPILRDAPPTSENKATSLRLANTLAFVVTVVLNGLGATGKLTGHTVGDISDEHPTLITPAGFTFAIWGVIYTLQTGFVLWQACTDSSLPVVRPVGWTYAITCFANAGWIAAFTTGTTRGIDLSQALILVLAIGLLTVYARAGCFAGSSSWLQFILVDLAFSMYTSWAVVASCLNASITMQTHGVDSVLGLSPNHTQTALLAIPLLICLGIVISRHDFVYPLTLAWAAHGIASNKTSAPLSPLPRYLSYGALALAVLALAARVCSHARRRRTPTLPGPR